MNTTELKTFNFNSNELRVITGNDGEPWFIAKDVADILGYSDASKMIYRLDDDEKSNRQISGLGSPTGGRGTLTINESGLYSAILGSKKPEAKAFKKHVTSEILPTIRKTGSYSVAKPKTALELAKEQVLLLEQIEQANIKIEHQEKIIEQKDKFICASNEASVKAGEILVRELVKSVDTIDLGEKQFYQWLRDQHLIFPDRNEPYQPYINAGYFTWKPSDKEINGKIRYQLRITPRGKIWLASRYMAWYDSRAQLHLPTEKRNGLASINGGIK